MTESVVIIDKTGDHTGIVTNPLYVTDSDSPAVDQNNLLSLQWLADNGLVDSFGRLRISEPVTRFDSQFTYNLHPLLYEQITNGAGASINHDVTERMAQMSFLNTPNGGQAYMQSYKHCYYHPGNSHQVLLTFNFRNHIPNVTKIVGYGDLTNNGIHFISNGTGFAWRILSNTSNGDETVLQANWNIDKLDGTGASGINLEVGNTQIAVIDLQALYVGRVRVGFDIGGRTVYCHEFLHANKVSFPFIQSASLPVICGMTCSDTVTTNMFFFCATVRSEGADLEEEGFGFSVEGTVTAGNGARTHILAIRPKTTFNGIVNRINFVLESIEVTVTGANPILWELVIGQAISGTTAFNDVNATYSGFEYNTLGTISGNPAIVISSGYVASSNQSKNSISKSFVSRYPITLDAAGAVRLMGTIGVIVTGIGGTSATRVVMNWREIR
jgi:hypothetical protein